MRVQDTEHVNDMVAEAIRKKIAYFQELDEKRRLVRVQKKRITKLEADVAQLEAGRTLTDIMHHALEEYNETNAAMPLVLFTDAMKHICRVTRVINNPSGHALLVGVGGMGKQSLSRLSAHICGYTTVQIQISQAYTITSSPGLKEDLKVMYQKAGLKEEGISFLFTDSQIADEKFLVYINDLLSSGDIPDLYAVDERDEILNTISGRCTFSGCGTS